MTKNKIDLTKFKIFGDNVLVKGIEIEETGGVIRPSSYENKPELGRVIAFGKGRILEDGTIIPQEVKRGDVVLFNKYSSTKFNLDGNDYFIVRMEDIVGKQ